MPSCIALQALSRRLFFRSLLVRATSAVDVSRKLSDYSKSTDTVEWRKAQLDQLEQKFSSVPSKSIQSDIDLQPEWKSMESRVTKRRALTIDQLGGKTGRLNIKRTEEDFWSESGLYDSDNGTADSK
jgi:hypothetical protein